MNLDFLIIHSEGLAMVLGGASLGVCLMMIGRKVLKRKHTNYKVAR